MKRFLYLWLVLCLLLTLCACEPDEPEPSVSTNPTQNQQTPSDSTSPPAPSQDTEKPTESQPPYRIANTVAKAYRDEDGHIWAMGIAEIVNTGETPLLLDYSTFTLSDGAGEPVMTVESVAAYPQILMPGEHGYYFEVVEPDLSEEETLELTLDPQIVPAAQEAVRYEVHYGVLQDTRYGGLNVSGTVENSTDKEGALVCVAAVLLDGDEQPLGVIYKILTESLAAGASAEFSMDSFMLPGELRTADVAKVLYFAYPLQN